MIAPDTHDRPTASLARRPGARARLGLAAIGLLALGGAAGAVVVAESRPAVSIAPVVPVAIRSLGSSGIVTIRGRVAEIYGNKLIVADGSGRALVDLGPEGDNRSLVTVAEPVTAQGRFDRGVVHAAFLVGADGKVVALGPLAGPPRAPHRPRERRSDGEPDGPPPPGAGLMPPAPAAAPTVAP